MSWIRFLNISEYLKFIKKLRFVVNRAPLLEAELNQLKHYLFIKPFKEFDSKYPGRRCFILGNGPSLDISDLEKLKNEFTFASNKIYLAFDKTSWRPTFYSVEDNLVIEQNFEEIQKVEAKYKIFPDFTLKDLVIDPLNIFFKFNFEDEYPELPKFGKTAEEGFYWGSTIVYTQIQLAFYMGFTEIYLMGVDYCYNEPKERKNNALICEGEVNHFHKDYRKPGEKWNLPNLHYHERSFAKVKKEAEERNIKIFNATRGGKLETFPRANFDKLFQG